MSWLGRGYEAFSTGKDVYDGIQMIRQGNNWGWLSIAEAGLEPHVFAHHVVDVTATPSHSGTAPRVCCSR